MKKFLVSVAVLACTAFSAQAQSDLRILNHLSVGAEVGTMGWGVDVAMPVTPFIDVQAGFDMMPKLSLNTSIDVSNMVPGVSGITYDGPNSFDIKGKLNMVNGKVLVNVMPIPSFRTFHLTVGAYFGKGDLIEVTNKEDGVLSKINETNEKIRLYNAANPATPVKELGLELGDYLLQPDAAGNVKAVAKINTAKPYVGFGFGKAVPNKRVGFKFDLGCLFWGKPTIDCNGVDLAKQDLDGKDGGAVKVISKLSVYPVLNFRLCGRIF